MEQVLQILPWVVVLVLIIRDGLLLWQAGGSKALLAAIPRISPIPASAPVASVAPVKPPAPVVLPSDVVDAGLVAFVKKEEGFTAKAVWDYKQYSIGYGTVATSAAEVITEQEAAARLTAEIGKAAALVENFSPAAPKGVKQALTDLTYNAGAGWEHQGLGTEVKAGNYAAAKSSILQYNHAGGQVLAGLTTRREAEASWFDNPL